MSKARNRHKYRFLLICDQQMDFGNIEFKERYRKINPYLHNFYNNEDRITAEVHCKFASTPYRVYAPDEDGDLKRLISFSKIV